MDDEITITDLNTPTPVVYALYRDGDANIYIGSTSNLRIRRQSHKTKVTNPKYSQLLYTYARKHGNWSEWKVEVLEHLSEAHISSLHLKMCEQRWIDDLLPTLNSNKASTGLPTNVSVQEYKQQYYNTNKLKYKASYSQYVARNREKVRKYHKKYGKAYRKRQKRMTYTQS